MDKARTLLLAVILMLAASSSNMAMAQKFGSSFTFYNELERVPANAVSITCQSQDKPETGFFGKNDVQPGDKYYFNFEPNLTASTVYGCTLRWGAKTAGIQAWHPNNPFYCSNCEYHVRRDGIYQSDNRLRKQTFFRVAWTG